MKTKQQQQSARRFLSYLSMYNASLVPCNSFNGKPIFKYIYLQNQFRLNNYGAQFARMQCLQKFGLNINFKFLKYIIHRRYVFFLNRKFLGLSREQCFFCIHKYNCWYHDCAIEHRLIGRWIILIGSFELNINTRSNIFNSLQPLFLILGDSRNYMPPTLVISSAKRIATQFLVAKLNGRIYFILRVFVCDITRPSKELPVQS